MKQSMIANEWREEGRAEGPVEARGESILTLLQIRFHTKPPEIVERVTTTQDHGLLSRWFTLAATADSLADFQAAMEE